MAIRYNVTQTQTLRRSAGFIVGASLQSGAGGAGSLTLYDGIATNGEKLLVLGAPISEFAESTSMRIPFYMGLHAVVSGSPDHASVDVEK